MVLLFGIVVILSLQSFFNNELRRITRIVRIILDFTNGIGFHELFATSGDCWRKPIIRKIRVIRLNSLFLEGVKCMVYLVTVPKRKVLQ